MHAHGVYVFHAAHRYRVAYSVAHRLEFYLLPTVNVPFDKHLMYRGNVESGRGDRTEFLLVVRHSAAVTAQRERRSYYYGISYALSNRERFRKLVGYVGRDTGLPYALHGLLEKLPVLRFAYRFCVGAYESAVVRLQKAFLLELHRKREPRLSAQRTEYTVRLLFDDYTFDRFQSERLEIYFVRERLVGHYRGGIGIDEHHFDARRFQYAASLRARVIEFRRLSYNYRSRTYYEYLFYPFIKGHTIYPPSSCV